MCHPRGRRRPSPRAPAPSTKGRRGWAGWGPHAPGWGPSWAGPPPAPRPPTAWGVPRLPGRRQARGGPPKRHGPGAARGPPAAGPDRRGGGARAPEPRGGPGAQPWLRQEVRGRGRRRARPMAAAGRRWAQAAPRRGLRPRRAASAGLTPPSARGPRTATARPREVPIACHPPCQAQGHGWQGDGTGKVPALGNW